MERERQVLVLGLAIMVGLVVIIGGAMVLGAELAGSRCAVRTTVQARTIDSLVQANDSLSTTLRLLVCIRPGNPPSVHAC